MTQKEKRYQKKLFVRDLPQSGVIEELFLIKESTFSVDKNGRPYLILVLMDRTGELDARVWENVPEYANVLFRGAFVQVEGKIKLYQGRKQFVVQKAQMVREEEVCLEHFLPKGHVDSKVLFKKLQRHIQSIEDIHYRSLAEAILSQEEVQKKLLKYPAAKSIHHAYPGGLLEHVVSVLEILEFLSKHYAPFVERDLLLLGGFLHDIGKLWELSAGAVTDYTDEGRLVGHLVMGVDLVEKTIQELNKMHIQDKEFPFPVEKSLLIKHVILSHHGELAYGSPKRPKCLEAFLVHWIDYLDSKWNEVFQFLKKDPTPSHWSSLHRRWERYFYKSTYLENQLTSDQKD